MPFGDVKINYEIGEDGVCRCHGLMGPARTSNGDIARVTAPQECIMQRLAIWLAVKKGERPLHPQFGCVIRSYINMPLTMAVLKELTGLIRADLIDLFPEYTVSNLRITVPERNTIDIKVNIGGYDVEFVGNEANLAELRDMLNAALRDLGMAYQ